SGGEKLETRSSKLETNSKSEIRKNPSSAVQSSRFKIQGSRFPGWQFYLLSLLLFALGLMSKPMLVTVPFVLLLLDFWPLRRFELSVDDVRLKGFRLLLEKVPFFALAAASSAITFYAQNKGHAVSSVESL